MLKMTDEGGEVEALRLHTIKDLRPAKIEPSPIQGDDVRIAVKAGGVRTPDLAYNVQFRSER